MASSTVAQGPFVRGNTIAFTTNFYNGLGSLADPASATLYVVYPLGSNRVAASPITMSPTAVAGVWTATWESSVADEGRVSFSVETGGVSPFTREDGFFMLTANEANQEP